MDFNGELFGMNCLVACFSVGCVAFKTDFEADSARFIFWMGKLGNVACDAVIGGKEVEALVADLDV